MPCHAVVSVMSKDRTGIIAEITKPILELGGNICAISQTVLRGYFTIIFAVDFPEQVTLDTVREAIRAVEPTDVTVSVLPRDPAAAGTHVVADGECYVLTIQGRDEPGIIHRISAYLFGREINVVDLYAEARDDEFTMIGQVEVSTEQDIHQIRIDLEQMWRESRIKVTLQHENVFAATNEIDFRHAIGPQGRAV